MNVRLPRELVIRVKMHATALGKPLQAFVAETLDKAVPAYKLQSKRK